MMMLIITIVNFILASFLIYGLYKINKFHKENKKSSTDFKDELQNVLDQVIIKLIKTMSDVDEDRKKSIDLVAKVIDKMDRAKTKLLKIQNTHDNLDNTVVELTNNVSREFKSLQMATNTNKDSARLIASKNKTLNDIVKKLNDVEKSLKNKLK